MTIRDRLSELLKKFKVDIEGRLFNFSVRRRGGVDIKQRGEINIVLVSPDAVGELVQAHGTRQAVERGEKELRGFTRDDLAGYDAIVLAAQYDDKLILETMAGVVPPEDLAALSIAMSIKRVEEAGNAVKAVQLRNRLRRRYGERGNRILIFFSTSLFREFMGPLLAMVQYTPTITMKTDARRVFDRCIEHMDHAVYVNSLYTTERIETEIRFRFDVDRVNVVLVFGLGKAIIRRMRDAVSHFTAFERERQTSPREFRSSEEEFSLKSINGLTIVISKAGSSS